MLFFKIVIAAVLAATTSGSPVQDDQTFTREVLQRRFVEFSPIIEKRSPLKTRASQMVPRGGPGFNKPCELCGTVCCY
ncbi:uncharacterized protein MELLADRAFT_124538 [Melampsora larici-populina 98AG31]|uniref:Secreted protein n=1 Tax=Melampsora larici-populina (strain 98AG31 / pathotype 3-4-7) TaxID=747676 RepID=F4RQD9_MELLP|nr:uncharacterized protein MELLADRAFT_124538 [Melampsora larici-populina 98AG31]EGG05390.1 secreted protein [Melampsora larici-populina 98AG31]